MTLTLANYNTHKTLVSVVYEEYGFALMMLGPDDDQADQEDLFPILDLGGPLGLVVSDLCDEFLHTPSPGGRDFAAGTSQLWELLSRVSPSLLIECLRHSTQAYAYHGPRTDTPGAATASRSESLPPYSRMLSLARLAWVLARPAGAAAGVPCALHLHATAADEPAILALAPRLYPDDSIPSLEPQLQQGPRGAAAPLLRLCYAGEAASVPIIILLQRAGHRVRYLDVSPGALSSSLVGSLSYPTRPPATVAPLQGLVSLTEMTLGGINLGGMVHNPGVGPADFEPLSNLTSLSSLTLEFAHLKDLSFLESLGQQRAPLAFLCMIKLTFHRTDSSSSLEDVLTLPLHSLSSSLTSLELIDCSNILMPIGGLSSLSNLRALSLHGQRAFPPADVLSSVAQHAPDIASIRVGSYPDFPQEALTPLSNMSRLTELHLYLTNFDSPREAVPFLCSSLPSIQDLIIRNTNAPIQLFSVRYAASSLLALTVASPHASAAGFPGGAGEEALFRIGSCLTHLTHLDLSDSPSLESKALRFLAPLQSSLRSLVLAGGLALDSRCMEEVTCLTGLSHLDLARCIHVGASPVIPGTAAALTGGPARQGAAAAVDPRWTAMVGSLKHLRSLGVSDTCCSEATWRLLSDELDRRRRADEGEARRRRRGGGRRKEAEAAEAALAAAELG